MDRIDIHIEVTPVPFEELSGMVVESESDHLRSASVIEKNEGGSKSMSLGSKSESSEEIRARVIDAREIQLMRFKDIKHIHSNAQMETRQIQEYCQLDHTSALLLKSAMKKLELSARAYDRILKVSRTIADLANSESITMEHIAEAIQYRSLDREGWGG